MFLYSVLRSVIKSRLAVVMLRKNDYCNRSIYTTGENLKRIDGNADNMDYESAIQKLNTLQSNAASIRQSILNQKMLTNLDDTIMYLNRSGISMDELDKLSVIHVSGTKGKGSTCALVESILKEYGVRTGFFSSPHLVSVTERFRINGEAISKKKFCKAFWKVYNRLDKCKQSDVEMPSYFKFLTILCFHIFFEEKVDVAILEVGIGGKFDSTNIVRNSTTVGITTLGLEHTNILGHTMEEITLQKEGIVKPYSRVYTNVKQAECLEILRKKAAEKNATIKKVPALSEYSWPRGVNIDNFNKMAHLNGSLAIQLAYSWLREYQPKNLNVLRDEIKFDDIILTISDQVAKAFVNCVWPGRCQTMDFDKNLRLHLDGAHTLESMAMCGDWYKSVTKGSANNPKVLIFNVTGERDSKALLNVLTQRINFDAACFVPNIPFHKKAVGDIHSDTGLKDQIRRAEFHAENWRDLTKSEGNAQGTCRVFETVLGAFENLRKEFGNRKIEVLVTGSIHLLGATILALKELEIK